MIVTLVFTKLSMNLLSTLFVRSLLHRSFVAIRLRNSPIFPCYFFECQEVPLYHNQVQLNPVSIFVYSRSIVLPSFVTFPILFWGQPNPTKYIHTISIYDKYITKYMINI